MPPDDVTQSLGDFFEYYFADTKCNVYIATLEKGDNKTFKQFMVEWPKNKNDLVRSALAESAQGKDVYFCPSPFEPGPGIKAVRENVIGSRVLFADFDKQSAPENWDVAAEDAGIPAPTQIVQSSVVGNQHVYWRFDDVQTVDWVEEKNRAVAHKFGADISGWDANQLLRIPYTYNYGHGNRGAVKDWYEGKPVYVEVIKSDTTILNTSSFEPLAIHEEEIRGRITLDNIPSVQEALAFGNMTQDLFGQFNMTEQEASESSVNKRSGALQKLAYMLAEAGGFTDEQMYSLIQDTDERWGKYVKRSKAGRHKILLDTIARARSKIGYVDENNLHFAGLLETAATQEVDSAQLVYSLDEFLALDLTVEWLMEGLLTKRASIGMIAGEPGIGKTQFTLGLGMALSLGVDYLGWKNEAGPAKVLFLSLEMGVHQLGIILPTIAEGYDDTRVISKNFKIAPLGETIPLDTKAGQDFLENLIDEYQPDVVIADSFQKITYAGISDDPLMRKLMGDLKRQSDAGNFSLILVHHNRKPTANATKGGIGSLADLYGSTFIGANLDWCLALTHNEAGTLNLSDWKVRYSEPKTREIIRTKHLHFELCEVGQSLNQPPDETQTLIKGAFI